MTDSIMATLYQLHQRKYENKTRRNGDFLAAVQTLLAQGCEVNSPYDRFAQIFEIYMPNSDDADRYAFCFLLSKPFRAQVYNRLTTSLLNKYERH